ncbi:galactose-1-phosphate uridylyltransferase [Thermoanaerobacterium sp. RBIITD]|uniref:galactose-1-phosphate uridylyltransferase n=1 Tax=Thermoanaerobacterium sp. RBIITD TaxID=1550240 RepID=UPI000BB7DD1B|nr:galactose-1-phosphate uridylyltransferase [Thermoanaerobacterium sp. RBIITD]SNX53384.1 UDPglucose--hexose-1-phosphate uridylyltransferase [Thermoanaerobacterium sp. RBIITD]
MSEIRYDIVTGKATIISTERGKRPHDFKITDVERAGGVCPFCPGNEHMTPPTLIEFKDEKGMWTLRGFNNKFAAFSKDAKTNNDIDLYKNKAGYGVAEIIVETPNHDKTLGQLDLKDVENIIKALIERYDDIVKDENIKYVQMFKNFGLHGGASLEHGHWQIIAVPFVPEIIEKEIEGTEDYKNKTGTCPYCDMIRDEKKVNTRVVAENDRFIVICPYASQFPYETWILPKNHMRSFNSLDENDVKSIATLLQPLIKKYEDIFNYPPYNVVVHTLPVGESRDYHWHIEILPRLTTAAGFELATGAYINPTPPEEAASILRL